MKRALFVIVFLGIIYQVAKSAEADKSTVIGSWKCAVTDVPSQYSNSVITFAEKDGKLTGSVKFDSGEEVKISTVTYNNSQLVITLYVEGNPVTVEGKVSGTKITGTADIPDGKVKFTANKIVEKK